MQRSSVDEVKERSKKFDQRTKSNLKNLLSKKEREKAREASCSGKRNQRA
jgi:hypothetical protein